MPGRGTCLRKSLEKGRGFHSVLTSDQTAEPGVGAQSIRWDRASSGQASTPRQGFGSFREEGQGTGGSEGSAGA